MKREIKFKAFYNGIMSQPFEVHMIPALISAALSHGEDVPMLQYTGIQDRSGVEIYEGDILEGHSDGNVSVSFVGACWTCVFEDEATIGLDEMCIWFGNKATVIGNALLTPNR